MIHYIIRRLLLGMLTLLLITLFIYGLIRAMPGSPLLVQMAQMDPSRELNEEDLKRMEKAGDISEDEHRQRGDEVQKLTDEMITAIGEKMEHKEQDILQV